MPAEAGIQEVGDNNNFKDLDSRFRGNDGVFPITTQSPRGKGVIFFGCGSAALGRGITQTGPKSGEPKGFTFLLTYSTL